MKSPLENTILFQIGPVPIAETVVTTWVIMAVLVSGSWLITRRLRRDPSTVQSVAELLCDLVDSQIRETMRTEPGPYRAFIGTLFLFILVANWSSMIPGVEPPTAHLETDAGLAILVFFAVIWYGLKAGGARGYLKSFAAPTPLMIPRWTFAVKKSFNACSRWSVRAINAPKTSPRQRSKMVKTR